MTSAAGGVPTLETQLAVINVKLDVLIEQRSDQEARLRSLEKFKWVLAGFVMAGGGAAGGIVAKLVS